MALPIDELKEKLNAINQAEFIREQDESLNLAELKSPLRQAVTWAKRLISNAGYLDSLPAPKREEALQSIENLINAISDVSSVRKTDPTQFINSRESYISRLNSELANIQTKVVEPLRSYLVYSRGAEFVERAEKSLEAIDSSKEQAESAKSAAQEAAAGRAAQTSARHYDTLAGEFKKAKDNWVYIFFGYTAVLLGLFITVAAASHNFRTLIASFDTTEGVVLKLALLLIIGYGYGFIARNYQTNLQIFIIAKTRVTTLRTWRAFINAEELNREDTQSQKADITKIVAEHVFADVAPMLGKKSAKLIDNPVTVYAQAKDQIDRVVQP